MSSTDTAYGALVSAYARYAMYGTDIAYGATRRPQPSLHLRQHPPSLLAIALSAPYAICGTEVAIAVPNV
eukprot:1827393-Rhodomonas_salina.3